MHPKIFDELLDEIIERIKKVLSSKSAEYSSDVDKLYNFVRASEATRCSPEKALQGMWMKHLISIFDMIDKIEKADKEYNYAFVSHPDGITKKLVEEKITDAINYLILLEAQLKERYAW